MEQATVRRKECGYRIASVPPDAASIDQLAQPDLGPLQIKQNPDLATCFRSHLPRQIQPTGMFLNRAVRSIEPEYINSRINQLPNRGRIVSSRPECRNDFRVPQSPPTALRPVLLP